ncbi:AAA family ATPase [Arcicella rosea]|uniref:Putative ATP-binding protein involved in virulence n=1 Tax=Arcicella rosea TaxID=502909 RepID=A0A841EQB6_9BACT|nr:AAA family ATPase [Arcicella rosea]MBB6002898.1 putative ATP-binding protein involved in virulence [Arcicella rosea]
MQPIALKSFHIKNYRGIIDTQIDNIPDNTQWIFLTGENGFGKTSVLQAISEGLDDAYYSDAYETEPNKNMKVNTQINYEDGYVLLLNDGTIRESYESHYVAYGSTRLRVSAGTSNEVLSKYSSTESLFSNEVLLVNVEENFKDWQNNYEKGYVQLQDIFKALLPRLKEIKVEFDEKVKKSKVKYYEIDDEENQFDNGVEFIDLAAGYKSIIAMIGDMINRLNQMQYRENFNDLTGIVLIDEIELHLHPKYQKLFVEKLTELFPKIQFIVSTHSPIPLLGAPKNSVIINVSRTREEGIKAELLDIDFSVLTPNTILSSPIFGFQDLIPDSKSNDKMIRTEDTFAELKFNDQLKKDINTFLTKEKQEELLRIIKAS